jgi:hypothetical protein
MCTSNDKSEAQNRQSQHKTQAESAKEEELTKTEML